MAAKKSAKKTATARYEETKAQLAELDKKRAVVSKRLRQLEIEMKAEKYDELMAKKAEAAKVPKGEAGAARDGMMDRFEKKTKEGSAEAGTVPMPRA